eukprot:scaffold6744_cov29-Tisochrysis_lutea.AAC.3
MYITPHPPVHPSLPLIFNRCHEDGARDCDAMRQRETVPYYFALAALTFPTMRQTVGGIERGHGLKANI